MSRQEQKAAFLRQLQERSQGRFSLPLIWRVHDKPGKCYLYAPTGEPGHALNFGIKQHGADITLLIKGGTPEGRAATAARVLQVAAPVLALKQVDNETQLKLMQVCASLGYADPDDWRAVQDAMLAAMDQLVAVYQKALR